MSTKSTQLLVVVLVGILMPRWSNEQRVEAVPATVVGEPFSVMTQNLYIGTDLAQLIDVDNDFLFSFKVGDVLQDVRETEFSIRAEKIADAIAATRPVLVGLQEAARWSSHDPTDPMDFDAYWGRDFLKILRSALQARGLSYHLVVSFSGFSFESPGVIGGLHGTPVYVQFNDRDMILAREGTTFEFSNPQKARFVHNLDISDWGIPDRNVYPRGWESVDVHDTATGRDFRFINTHLEAFSVTVRNEQASEIIHGPADVDMPVIIVGDFNAVQGQTTYNRVVNAGFRDAWRALHPAGTGGYTCCQDADLANSSSDLSHRIDMIFVRGELGVRKIQVVGEEQADKTSDGLWPSDHAGVVAKLEFN